VITADHGCDPTWRGTDHTREQVPVLVHGPDTRGSLGLWPSYAEVAELTATHLGIKRLTDSRIVAKTEDRMPAYAL